MRILFQIVFFLLCVNTVLAQELPLNSQIFMNPYYYNPAFAGFEDRPAFYLYRRQQWTGIEGAPTTMGFSFHTIFNEKVTFGLNVINDKRSILNSTSALLTLGYRVTFDDFHYISFAISGGVGSNTIDLDEIDPNDPAIFEALDNNIFLDGNAGFNYYNKGFNFGLSLPKIFKTNTISNSSFSPGEISPLTDAILTTSYRWEISEEKFAIEPFAIYYYSEDMPGQFEAAGLMHLMDVFWLGASYRQEYGITGLVGINIKDNFKFGYAYEFYNTQPAVFDNGTHDIQLAMIFGKKKKKGKVNLIQQRRNMLQSMGKLPSQQKTVQVENDPFVPPPAETYNEEEALQDLIDDMNTDQQVVEQVPEVPIEEVAPEQDEALQELLDEMNEESQAQEIPVEPEVIIEEPVVPEPEIIDEEEALIRQMEDEGNEQITFDDPVELIETEAPEAGQKEEFIEPTLDDQGKYIGPTTVTKGDHLLELEKGNYVVVGTFGSYRDAEEHSDQLFIKGFYTKFGYISQTKIYYVYIFESEDLQEAKDTSERFKSIGAQFRENWVLQVQ
ncbi:MAG: PorP/SprF family type IX secretion system membrane protein [Cyclobacteriaceae bacterium]|nr:PorP/SprF family type IX secretion system membrane protein [Cyclobacteriaceae bacterium]